MRHAIATVSAVACIMTASCATPGGKSDPTAPPTGPNRGKTQDVFLRTNPDGASCSVLRDSAVVTVVEATPGIAVVPRRDAPIEIVCRKEGFLAYRGTFVAESAAVVEKDEQALPTSGDVGLNVAVLGAAQLAGTAPLTAYAAAMGAASAGAVAAAVGGIVLLPAIAIYMTVANPPYAFRRLPEFVLTPATFDNEATRDAYFVRRNADLDAFGSVERARIVDGCQKTHCQLQLERVLAEGKSQQPEDCFSRFCRRVVDQGDSAQRLRVERLDAERAQTRVGTQ